MNLKDQRAQLLGEAQATIAKAKAANRDLTADESQSVESMTAEARKLGEQIAKAEESQALVRRLAAMGLQNNPDPEGINTGWGIEGVGYMRLKSGAPALGRRLAAQIPRDQSGRKALVGGGAVVSAIEVDITPIELGKPALSLFDVMQVHTRSVPQYRYFRQSTRTNLAAVVAPGDPKPVSVYTVSLIDGELAVIAHLSEALDTYALGDDSALGGFVTSELSYGLARAVEAKVVADIAATSGIQTQSYVATNVFTTTRTALTALTTVGAAGAYWIMHPADWQRVELTTATTGEFILESGPVETSGKRLWLIPVVESLAVPAGTAYLFGEGAVELSTDGSVSLRWLETGDDFTRNQIHARCEGRFNTDVVRPFGIVKLTIA